MIGKPYKMLSKIGYNGAMIIQHRFYALSDYIPYLKTNLHKQVVVPIFREKKGF
jgi:peptidoglycan/xylan/chitin deacetylase (PgdA/CDA1 family)